MAILSDVFPFSGFGYAGMNLENQHVPEPVRKEEGRRLFCGTFYYPESNMRAHFAVWGTDLVEATQELITQEPSLRTYPDNGTIVRVRDEAFHCA